MCLFLRHKTINESRSDQNNGSEKQLIYHFSLTCVIHWPMNVLESEGYIEDSLLTVTLLNTIMDPLSIVNDGVLGVEIIGSFSA